MLSWLTLKSSLDQGTRDHASSGVGPFKSHRGYESELEYTGVIYAHLPIRNRLPWIMLRGVMNGIAAPLLKHLEL